MRVTSTDGVRNATPLHCGQRIAILVQRKTKTVAHAFIRRQERVRYPLKTSACFERERTVEHDCGTDLRRLFTSPKLELIDEAHPFCEAID